MVNHITVVYHNSNIIYNINFVAIYITHNKFVEILYKTTK